MNENNKQHAGVITALYDDWIAASGWSDYASQIMPVEV